MSKLPYIETTRIVVDKAYNPDYGDNRICKCGHPYHRHFDGYDNNRAVGCKYCDCFEFELNDKYVNYIVTTQGQNPKRKYKCETEADVLSAIGQDWRYEVKSTTGKSVDKFIPF